MARLSTEAKDFDSRSPAFRILWRFVVISPLADDDGWAVSRDATRHMKGVEVFKEAEKAAMKVMEEARAEAQQRKRESKDGQGELFAAPVLHRAAYYQSLKDRYTTVARGVLVELLRARKRLPYDAAWEAVLPQPLVWESDLKTWIKEWRQKGQLSVGGLGEHDRVPKLESRHFLLWKGGP
jgi:hypothetical protein